MIDYAATVVLGYVMGSLPWGLIVGYIWLRRDIRESGSGKTGTTNVLRTAGKIPAALVTKLLSLGVAGFPTVVVTRQWIGSTTIAPGRVDLVISSSLERTVTIDGLVSCTDTVDCPDGQTCQSDLTCK